MNKKTILFFLLALIVYACGPSNPPKVGYTLYVSPEWSSYYRTSTLAEYSHAEIDGIYTVYLDAREDYTRSQLPITSGDVTLSRVLFVGDANALGSNNTPYEEAGSKTAKWERSGSIRVSVFKEQNGNLVIERYYVDAVNDSSARTIGLPDGQQFTINEGGVIALLVEWKATDN